jgi:hypothetical protein
MHRRRESLVAEVARRWREPKAIYDHTRILARDLPETLPHATSRRLTTRFPAAPFTCSVAWVVEVMCGDVNHPHINGMQEVRVHASSAPSLDLGFVVPDACPKP